MKIVPQRGVSAPKGFKADGVVAGIKSGGKKDLALVYTEKLATAVAAFTTNKVIAAPVVVCKNNFSSEAHAIIINSGNANACNGPQGLADAKSMHDLTAKKLGCKPSKTLLASTGIIGRPLPLKKVKAGIKELSAASGEEADLAFAEAIMTTDAFPKQLAVEINLDNGPVWIGGTAKGAGMIAPDLKPHATTIAVITTDAPIKQPELQKYMEQALSKSFNAITVDGDTSTNDSFFLLANGLAGDFTLSIAEEHQFQEALDYICVSLAKMIVRDGEGATKLIEYKVVGAKTATDATSVAKAIANSVLVKTGFFGEDPNWGRILAAAGRAGVDLNPDDLDLDINGTAIVRSGHGVNVDLTAVAKQLRAEEIHVWINLNQGSYQAIEYGCDLSYDYVKLNSDYTS